MAETYVGVDVTFLALVGSFMAAIRARGQCQQKYRLLAKPLANTVVAENASRRGRRPGLPLMSYGASKIGLQSLTSKILCVKRHNDHPDQPVIKRRSDDSYSSLQRRSQQRVWVRARLVIPGAREFHRPGR